MFTREMRTLIIITLLLLATRADDASARTGLRILSSVDGMIMNKDGEFVGRESIDRRRDAMYVELARDRDDVQKLRIINHEGRVLSHSKNGLQWVDGRHGKNAGALWTYTPFHSGVAGGMIISNVGKCFKRSGNGDDGGDYVTLEECPDSNLSDNESVGDNGGGIREKKSWRRIEDEMKKRMMFTFILWMGDDSRNENERHGDRSVRSRESDHVSTKSNEAKSDVDHDLHFDTREKRRKSTNSPHHGRKRSGHVSRGSKSEHRPHEDYETGDLDGGSAHLTDYQEVDDEAEEGNRSDGRYDERAKARHNNRSRYLSDSRRIHPRLYRRPESGVRFEHRDHSNTICLKCCADVADGTVELRNGGMICIAPVNNACAEGFKCITEQAQLPQGNSVQYGNQVAQAGQYQYAHGNFGTQLAPSLQSALRTTSSSVPFSSSLVGVTRRPRSAGGLNAAVCYDGICTHQPARAQRGGQNDDLYRYMSLYMLGLMYNRLRSKENLSTERAMTRVK